MNSEFSFLKKDFNNLVLEVRDLGYRIVRIWFRGLGNHVEKQL